MNKSKCPDCGEEGKIVGWQMGEGLEAKETHFECPECGKLFWREGDYFDDINIDLFKEEVKS